MEVIGDCPECKAIGSMTIAEMYAGPLVVGRAAYCLKCQMFADIDEVVEARREKSKAMEIFK